MAASAPVTSFPQRSAIQIVWSAVPAANTFTPSQVGLAYADKGFTVQGTFDSATVLLVGSYDGTNYFTLHGRAGSAISLTAAGSDVIIENTPYIGATHSGGGGSESVTLTIQGSSYR